MKPKLLPTVIVIAVIGVVSVARTVTAGAGDRAEWNTGNMGVFGKFYARVGRTVDCQGDTSNTVRSRRP